MTWALEEGLLRGSKTTRSIIAPWCIASSIFHTKKRKRLQSKGCREAVFRRLDRC
jgi:hypothetical protein